MLIDQIPVKYRWSILASSFCSLILLAHRETPHIFHHKPPELLQNAPLLIWISTARLIALVNSSIHIMRHPILETYGVSFKTRNRYIIILYKLKYTVYMYEYIMVSFMQDPWINGSFRASHKIVTESPIPHLARHHAGRKIAPVRPITSSPRSLGFRI